MGPQPNSCGNMLSISSRSSAVALQWGHSQTAVETWCEWLKNGKDEWTGFNGATAKQLWKHDFQGEKNAEQNCFNGATAKQLWKRGQLRNCRVILWLQWGHSQTAVETRSASASAIILNHSASMGPQPNSCGNALIGAAIGAASEKLQWGHSQTAVETNRDTFHGGNGISFNGATAKQLWKHECPIRSVPRHVRFNGATAKQLWKLCHVRSERCRW